MTILIFQRNLYSQKEIIGKVEFYKSFESEWKVLESSNDKTIKKLNRGNRTIKFIQKDSIIKLKTDSTGIFKLRTISKDSIRILVNDHSSIANGIFEFAYREVNDTLTLRISDKKLAIYRDSIISPEFHRKYNEQQAHLDFKNGIRRILGGGGFLSDETIKRNKRLAKKYDLNYEYPFGCVVDLSSIRIMNRYNEVMKNLIGIKENVW